MIYFCLHTQRFKHGVRYQVVREDDTTALKEPKVVWEKFVAFGRDRAHRPAGSAFQQVALEQEQVAARMTQEEQS